MAAQDMEVQQNAGTTEQLPQGAAAAVNEALPTTGEPSAPEPVEVPIQYATPADYEPAYAPEDDDMGFVTGPTTRPGEAVTTGAYAPTRTQLSPEVRRNLPALVRLAARPDASDAFKSLVAFLVRQES